MLHCTVIYSRPDHDVQFQAYLHCLKQNIAQDCSCKPLTGFVKSDETQIRRLKKEKCEKKLLGKFFILILQIGKWHNG